MWESIDSKFYFQLQEAVKHYSNSELEHAIIRHEQPTYFECVVIASKTEFNNLI